MKRPRVLRVVLSAMVVVAVAGLLAAIDRTSVHGPTASGSAEGASFLSCSGPAVDSGPSEAIPGRSLETDPGGPTPRPAGSVDPIRNGETPDSPARTDRSIPPRAGRLVPPGRVLLHAPRAAGAVPRERDDELVWSPDREGVSAAVAENLSAIRECYDGWVKVRPDMRGLLKVKFVIEPLPDGTGARVVDARPLSSELGEPFMDGCVLNVFAGLKFAAQEDGRVTFVYPFRFEHGGGGRQSL